MPPSKPTAGRRPPLPRPLLAVVRPLASLRLGVVVTALLAAVLAWATFVESRYGTDAVRFAVYDSLWFAALGALLGINVLCAALVRLPWKKRQTGFLVTHAGILLLLAGCLFSALWGIDAQLLVFEDGTAQRAFARTQHFELVAHRELAESSSTDGTPTGKHGSAQVGNHAGDSEVIEIPFRAGPFNWQQYHTLGVFPWRLARRDRGLLYDRDGIRLEVLDYYADCRWEPAPPLVLQVRLADGASRQLRLSIARGNDPHSPGRGMGLGAREELPGGQRVVFTVAEDTAEVEAFRRCVPSSPLPPGGQVVLFRHGELYRLNLAELQSGRRVPLGQTGLELALREFHPRYLGAVFRVFDRNAPSPSSPERMILFADMVEFNRPDRRHGLYGFLWYDASDQPGNDDGDSGEPQADSATEQAAAERTPEQLAAASGDQSAGKDDSPNRADRSDTIFKPLQPRIDILQSPDGALFYRAWHAPRLAAAGALPVDGRSVPLFADSPYRVELRVDEFTPHDRPGEVLRAVDTRPKDRSGMEQRAARVRLTVDGVSEQFWLEGLPATPLPAPPSESQHKVIHGNGRSVELALAYDQIDIGFQVRLERFERTLDPGSSRAARYASLVDLLDPAGNLLQRNVWITLNQPASFSDPRTGRSYRIYQEAFRGPWKPGDPLFDQLIGHASPRNELYLSILTVNYDPGRGLKYFGSLLIVAGIAVMISMKSHFFQAPRGEKAPP